MDDVFKALADPTRRGILRLLRDGEMTAGQLAARFPISAASMSHHFNILRQADLVVSRRQGQLIVYALNTTVFQELVATVFDLFGQSQAGVAEEASAEERA